MTRGINQVINILTEIDIIQIWPNIKPTTSMKEKEKKNTIVNSWLTAPPFQETKVGFVLDCRTYLITIKVG